MAPVLGYWKIRGLAQPIRLLLGYQKIEFEDKIYEAGDAPDFDRSKWTSVKDSFGLDFPNVPYFIDGDIKITQSNAIMRHLARKCKMDGETEKEKVIVDMIENQAMDFRNGFVRLCYNPNFNDLVADYRTNIQNILGKFDKFLDGNKFFAGEKITFVDFIMYELLDQHRLWDAAVLNPYENLKAFLDRFEAIPEIADFMESDKCFKGPINNKQASFK